MSNSRKEILFIVNPIAGVKTKMEAIQLLNDELSSDYIYTVLHTTHKGHATELAQKAVEEKLDAVIAVGGDGTVNEVGKALIRTELALGVMPFGSGNGFARHRKIPLQPKEAIHCINRFNVKLIDTATLNNEVFLTTAGLGFDAHVSRKFAEDEKRGFLTYSQIAINEFRDYNPENYQLIVDGKNLHLDAFVITIANGGQYGNNAWIAPNASMKDGKLNISILRPFPIHAIPDVIYKLFNKTLTASKYYKELEAKEIHIAKARQYHIDGEPRNANLEDILIHIKPKSLRVIC